MHAMTTTTVESRSARETLMQLQHEIQLREPQLASYIAPYIDRPQLRLGQDGRIWLLAPREQDPHLLAGGGHILPESAVADLRRITCSGIEFQGIIFGHEIEMTAPVRALVPQLRDGPRSCPPHVARALVGPVPPHPGAARLARRMGAVAGLVARSATWLPRTTADALDPVIFGLIGADGQLKAGRPVLWVVCTKWDW